MEERVEDLWSTFLETRDPGIRERLILRYVPLVQRTVERMRIPSSSVMDGDDLFDLGIMGLIQAVDRFDPSKGTFEAYAVRKVRGAVLDGLRKMGWMPRNAKHRARRIEETISELEGELGRSPSEEEVAEKLGIPLELYRSTLEEVRPILMPLQRDEANLEEVLRAPGEDPSESAERREMEELLMEAIRSLPERHRKVIVLYYYEGLTLKEIGEVLGVSDSRVSQLHSEALLRLRAKMRKYMATEAM